MQSFAEDELESKPEFMLMLEELKKLVGGSGGLDGSFESLERKALRVANLVVRRWLQGQLQGRSDRLSEEVLVNGVAYRRHESGKVTYHSLVGGLTVRRWTYRRIGERNGPTVAPLELQCSLVERATPALGYSVALEYAQRDSRAYTESMAAAHRELPSRSTLERMAKAIGTAARKASPEIEPALRATESLPEGACGVSLGLDRVAVPMEEARAEGAKPKTRRKKRLNPYQRKKPQPVDVNYRMAYVGTVSVVDSNGEELVTRRYTALPDDEPDEVAKKVVADVLRAREQDPSLKVGVVQDGAPELWNATRRSLRAAGIPKWKETIDRWHAEERLGEALQLVERDEGRRAQIRAAWNDDLDKSDRAMDGILLDLGKRIDQARGEKKDKFLEHIVYIENNRARMRYASTRRQGLPVGSGLTEGACKSVVGQRTCGSGQRWHPPGIAAALTLRAIHRSDRLPRFWMHLSNRYTADIRKAQ